MKSFLSAVLLFIMVSVYSQSSNDVLNILVSNKTIKQEQADSVRAEYAIQQQNNVADKKLRIEFEFRPRTEYRNGYQVLRNDSSVAAFFVNQRSRLSLNYSLNNRFILQFSVQDLRVWGQQDPRSTAATLQVFEAWAEPYITDKFSIRVGRQKLVYDNQRIFGENDWRLSGNVHDAVNFRYYTSKIGSELALAFNQNAERYFGTGYYPLDFTSYKFLAVHYLRFSPARYFTITTINSTDGFQDKKKSEIMYLRYTLGGRIEAEKGQFYATFSGYYQGGRNVLGTNVSSWYIQPEVRFTTSTKLVTRLGVEVFSGTDNSISSSAENSFASLYGSAHRFNGSMDIITKFPTDTRGAGLVNPYLFIIQPIKNKFEIRSDFHTFYLQKNFYVDDQKIDKYLGFENDWLISYKPNAATRIDMGFSYMLPTKSLETVKLSGTSKYDLTWAYISLIFKPLLFSTTFK